MSCGVSRLPTVAMSCWPSSAVDVKGMCIIGRSFPTLGVVVAPKKESRLRGCWDPIGAGYCGLPARPVVHVELVTGCSKRSTWMLESGRQKVRSVRFVSSGAPSLLTSCWPPARHLRSGSRHSIHHAPNHLRDAEREKLQPRPGTAQGGQGAGHQEGYASIDGSPLCLADLEA